MNKKMDDFFNCIINANLVSKELSEEAVDRKLYKYRNGKGEERKVILASGLLSHFHLHLSFQARALKSLDDYVKLLIWTLADTALEEKATIDWTVYKGELAVEK